MVSSTLLRSFRTVSIQRMVGGGGGHPCDFLMSEVSVANISAWYDGEFGSCRTTWPNHRSRRSLQIEVKAMFLVKLFISPLGDK